MDRLLRVLVSAFTFLSFSMSALAQAELDPELDTSFKALNVCPCFEQEERSLGALNRIINIYFNQDSLAIVEVYWLTNQLESKMIPFDLGLLGLNNQEYQMELVGESLYQDSLQQMTYLVPSLEYSNYLQPSRMTFGQYSFNYNRMQPIDREIRCGEWSIPIK